MSLSNDRIDEFLATLNEEEALEAFHILRDRFQFIGAVFTSEDVHDAVASELENPLLMFEPCEILPELTDALREAVAASPSICRDVTEEMLVSGRPVLNVAVEMLIKELKENPVVQLGVDGETVLVTGFRKLDDAYLFAQSAINTSIQDTIAAASEAGTVVSCPELDGTVSSADLLATSFGETFKIPVDPRGAEGPTRLVG